YMSTSIAETSGLDELEPVQHHHAHVAAAMAEHGRAGPVLGMAFDGTGYGSDGKVWGCELMVADLLDFRRVGHLRYAPLPGGDRGARTPWRSLLGYASLDDPTWAGDALADVDPTELEVAWRQIERELNAPRASSLGRLFDAAAALLGIRLESRYEGQAAMELECAAATTPGRILPFPVRRQGAAEVEGNGQ
ncbi:MAG: carbamoyltransferase HypF, partial [Gammaproteobacteria bacterium]|nr:carbamoyltransferase HypF [Gemmatimonadota bacterium]NIR36551.1 carbamoyltransferase HypF [Actinomycetota bacterium]NIU74447.1 carbamoyltransferase HypF [Gammaproteobacteria bacterium]NIY08646.1 carbamoyltransferase HypF [Gemmatimonadota bacterium]